jgi:type I restriction enzyme S subunit
MRLSLGARHDFLRRYGVADNWEAKTLGNVAQVVGGGTPSRDESRFWIGGTIPWATPTDLTANSAKYISKTAECITEAGLTASAASLLPAGSILYTSRATIGAKAITAVPIATNQGFTNFIPDRVDSEYFYYLLELLTPTIKRLGAGTTFDEVSKREIRTIWCALPADPTEQAAIACILESVDTALERTRAAIKQARELRRALMQELLPPRLAYATSQARRSLLASKRSFAQMLSPTSAMDRRPRVQKGDTGDREQSPGYPRARSTIALSRPLTSS